MKWLAALVLSCLCVLAQAQYLSGPNCPANPVLPSQQDIAAGFAKATDRGFLWAIEKDGKTSHVFGTVHLGQFESMFPGPKLFAALKQAQVIALELNPMSTENQAFFAKIQKQDLLPMPEAIKQRLEAVAKDLCFDSALLTQVNQESLLSFLTVAGARKQGYYADWGSEIFFAGMAAGAKKSVVELESAQSQSAVLKESMGGDPQWRAVTQWLDDLDSGKTNNQLLRMLKAWNTSDYATFQSYLEWCECALTEDDKRRWRLLLDDRNDNLAARIAQEHGKATGPILAAVGALHFTGPKAVDKLLAKLGFTVTRLVPN